MKNVLASAIFMGIMLFHADFCNISTDPDPSKSGCSSAEDCPSSTDPGCRSVCDLKTGACDEECQ